MNEEELPVIIKAMKKVFIDYKTDTELSLSQDQSANVDRCVYDGALGE